MSENLEAPLTADQVAERVEAGQTNAFKATTSRSIASILRANVLTLFNAIVIGCAIILLALGRWQDALFGFAALSNAVIGTVQEFRAKVALDKLALLGAAHASVQRAEGEVKVPLAEVVLDDLLVLRGGDQVAADATALTTDELEADESLLTGESDPIHKKPGDKILSGSVIVAGTGLARVIGVGADSYANKLASEAKRFSLTASELRGGLDRVLRWVTWLVGPLGLLVLNAQMVSLGGWAEVIENGTWPDAVAAAVASIVAMIPLGLILMTSIAFAVGAVRLSLQQVLAQELAAVEGLARVDVICLDKTGTLTDGNIVFDAAREVSPAPGWEQALAWFGAQAGANATASALCAAYTEVPEQQASATVAFSSSRKWSSVSFSDAPAAGMWVLGAPEMVFPGHSHDAEVARHLEQLAEHSRLGLRALVLAHGSATGEARLPDDLRLSAMLTFRESIRSDAAETLEYFHEQGVAVRVISGDNPATVAAVARAVGMEDVVGFDARKLPEDLDELALVMENNTVFGRVTPEQKRAMVKGLQRAGHTVAMTGDGVNDALAIKEADIGIAMNSGSDATKAVSQLVLLDNSFTHLPHVVREGRQVMANIERVSMLFLSKTSYAVLLAILFGVLLAPFPFLPRQLALSDGLTIGIPAFFLALLANPKRYEPGFLRRSLSYAIPAGAIVTLALGITVAILNVNGIGLGEVRTASSLTLTLLGLWILLVLSRPFTFLKGLIVVGMIVGLIGSLLIPIARDFLLFTPPGPVTLTVIVSVTAGGIVLLEIMHAIQRRYLERLRERTLPSSVLARAR